MHTTNGAYCKKDVSTRNGPIITGYILQSNYYDYEDAIEFLMSQGFTKEEADDYLDTL